MIMLTYCYYNDSAIRDLRLFIYSAYLHSMWWTGKEIYIGTVMCKLIALYEKWYLFYEMRIDLCRSEIGKKYFIFVLKMMPDVLFIRSFRQRID